MKILSVARRCLTRTGQVSNESTGWSATAINAISNRGTDYTAPTLPDQRPLFAEETSRNSIDQVISLQVFFPRKLFPRHILISRSTIQSWVVLKGNSKNWNKEDGNILERTWFVFPLCNWGRKQQRSCCSCSPFITTNDQNIRVTSEE